MNVIYKQVHIDKTYDTLHTSYMIVNMNISYMQIDTFR